MEKAYDVKALIEQLKPHGMDIAEDVAKKLVEEVLDWAQASALKSENKIDDVVAGLVPVIKPVIMEQLDKIDGQEG